MTNPLRPCPVMRANKFAPDVIINACGNCPNRQPVSLDALARRVEKFEGINEDAYECGFRNGRNEAAEMIKDFEKELNK